MATDQEIHREFEREQQERKRRKALGRIARLKAQQSGATKKMPLQGGDALRFIFSK